MKTYLQMDGDQLVEYVEKREYDTMTLLAHDLANERDALKTEIEKMKKNDWDELRK